MISCWARFCPRSPASLVLNAHGLTVAAQVNEGAADKAATKAAGKLRVCIATADFWGLKAAGGTATAYHLMAAALAKHSSLQVLGHGMASEKQTHLYYFQYMPAGLV